MSPEKQAILLQCYPRLFAGKLLPGTPAAQTLLAVRDGWFNLLNELFEFLVGRYIPVAEHEEALVGLEIAMRSRSSDSHTGVGSDDKAIRELKNEIYFKEAARRAYLKDCIQIERVCVDQEGQLQLHFERSTAHQLVEADWAAIHMAIRRSASVCEVCEQRGFFVSSEIPATLCPEHILQRHGATSLHDVLRRYANDELAVALLSRYDIDQADDKVSKSPR